MDWSHDCLTVYNHIRGLSPYPAAHAQIRSESGEPIDLKIFASEMELVKHDLP